MTEYRLPAMNLWSDDNASMMEAFISSDLSSFWPPSSASTTAIAAAANASDPLKSMAAASFLNQDSLQQRLQALIEGARESWTYAIYWQSSVDGSGVPFLGWGDGYYKGEEDKRKRKASAAASAAVQEHRKQVLRDLNSLISGSAAVTDDAIDEEVTDTEWFFLVSMTQSFVNGAGIPAQVFFAGSAIWIAGGDRLAGSVCERAQQAQSFGMQTMVCIPSANGVVELGSTEVILQSLDLMSKVRVLFNFNGLEIGGGGGIWSSSATAVPAPQADQGESDPSALWLTDPSPAVEIKDSAAAAALHESRALVASLSERWRDETHSFHFPHGELTISLEDIVQCWGLRVVGTPVFSEGAYSEPDANRDLFRKFFGFLPSTKGAQIPLAWLYTTYCPAKAQELAYCRLAAQCVTPDVEVGDVEAPNGEASSTSSGGGGEDGASGAIPPLEVVEEQHQSGTNAGSSSGVSRKGIPTASHKRRRVAGIPDLEYEVHLRKKVVVNPRESFQPPGEPTNMNPDAHLRAFLLYFLGSTFFCGSSGNFAIGALLHYLEDLDKFKDYAWGAAALAHLFWSLDNRVRNGRGRNNLGGFVAIMQVWAWEHLSTCRPTQLLDRQDLFPRAARWYPSANMRSFERTLPAEVAARLRHAGLRHGENEYRYVYNELDDNEILWRPYGQITEASPAIVREAVHLFNKDIWLHAPRIAARLVMSRATRQFQDHAVVPPPSDDPLTYMYKGWSQRTFKSSHPCAEEIEDWNKGGQLAGQHVFALPYDTWWLTTPHRQFLPRVYRGGSYFTIKNRFEELEQLRGEKAALEREVEELRVHPTAGFSPQVLQSEILMKAKEDLQRRMGEMERKWREEKEEMERKLKEKEESEQRLQDRLADMEQTIEGLTNQDQLSKVQKEVASLRTEVANLKSLEAVASEDGALCKRKVTTPLSLRRSKRNHRVT